MILAIIMTASVAAVGVAPGTIRLPYTQEQQTARIIVVNNQDEQTMVMISIAGELADSISLAENSLDMAPREERELSLAVMLPSLTPGEHQAQIIISEVPKGQSGGTGISATGGVISRLIVDVPYPDRYLTAAMKADDMAIVVQVTNKGSLDIAVAGAEVNVKGKDGLITLLNTDEKQVKKGEMRELVAYHMLLPGEYDADAVVRYDGNTLAAYLGFEVGYPKITIKEFSVDRREGISRLSLELESNWNAPIEVYGVSQIESEIVKSPTVTVPARGRNMLDLFFTSDAGTVKITLHYRGRAVEQEIVLKEKEQPSVRKSPPVLLVSAVVLVITALAVLLWRIHARRR